MNDEIMKVRRAKFEAAFPDDRFVWNEEECGYWPAPHAHFGDGVLGQCLTRDKHLIVWNAALDSICVELPSKYQDEEGYSMYQVCEIVDAMTAAGVKYKWTALAWKFKYPF